MKQLHTIFSFILLITPLVYAENASPPWIELNFQPSPEANTDMKITLMPDENELIDGDAFTLYQQAITSFPKDFNTANFSEWRKLPNYLDQLPLKQIETELKNLEPTIELINQAAMCKDCNWPYIKPEQVQQKVMDDLAIYRNFSYILDVKAKLQIIQGHYDQAIETIKDNLTIANRLGSAPSLVQAMVGIAIGKINIDRIEQIIQSDNAPNLYYAIKSLPQPLTDVNNAIKFEVDNLNNYNIISRLILKKQLDPSHERIKKQMNYLDRRVAILQIIEALRLYAGSHDGKFPERLSNITKYEIPNDPVTDKPFSYKSTGTEAILQIEGTEGSDGRDSVRYEIKLK